MTFGPLGREDGSGHVPGARYPWLAATYTANHCESSFTPRAAPAGPPHCVTSVAALRAAQKTGQASIDVASNVYFSMTVHPETR
jgi:hypothetical protein